jgi:hypothetical protein
MTEVQLLKSLTTASGFWDDEDCQSFAVAAQLGSAIRITKDKKGMYRWEVVWADLPTELSKGLFSTATEAKADLRTHLEELLFNSTPPTKLEIDPPENPPAQD